MERWGNGETVDVRITGSSSTTLIGYSRAVAVWDRWSVGNLIISTVANYFIDFLCPVSAWMRVEQVSSCIYSRPTSVFIAVSSHCIKFNERSFQLGLRLKSRVISSYPRCTTTMGNMRAFAIIPRYLELKSHFLMEHIILVIPAH